LQNEEKDMEAKRYIGIDLHRNCFTACLRLENGREHLKQWKLEDMAKFTGKLRPTDQVAVEVTGNTRLFHDAVAPHVERVVAVNPKDKTQAQIASLTQTRDTLSIIGDIGDFADEGKLAAYFRIVPRVVQFQ